MRMLNAEGYKKLVAKAREFAAELESDAGFSDPNINRVALESMLVGWLSGTKAWRDYEKYCKVHHPRENLFLMAQDYALQAATDAWPPLTCKVCGNTTLESGGKSCTCRFCKTAGQWRLATKTEAERAEML